MSKIFNVYRNILFIAALLFLAVTCLPLPFKIQPYIILSSSMEPTVHTGSLCFIDKNIKSDSINASDIIAFDIEGITVVHRVQSINEETGNFVTKGDNNESIDLGEVSPDMVIGRAMFSIPKLGFVISYIKEPQGMVICGAAILVSIVSSIIYSDSEPRKKKNQKQAVSASNEETTTTPTNT